MAPMKFIVKYFSEIAIKSKPVRHRLVSRLVANLREVLQEIDPAVTIEARWDRLSVESTVEGPGAVARMVDAMRRVSGVTYILEVSEFPLPNPGEVVEHVLPLYEERLAGRHFAVRCKRTGSHPFTSVEIGRAHV